MQPGETRPVIAEGTVVKFRPDMQFPLAFRNQRECFRFCEVPFVSCVFLGPERSMFLPGDELRNRDSFSGKCQFRRFPVGIQFDLPTAESLCPCERTPFGHLAEAGQQRLPGQLPGEKRHCSFRNFGASF